MTKFHVVLLACTSAFSLPSASFASESDDRLDEALQTAHRMASVSVSHALPTETVRKCFVAVDELLRRAPSPDRVDYLHEIARHLEPLCQRGPNSRLEQFGLLYLLEQAGFETDEEARAEGFGEPVLTSGEHDALRLSVQRCWNVGALSTEALNTVVTVSFNVKAEGTVDPASIVMGESTGASGAAIRQSYEAARRALLRCGVDGLGVPSGEYELTFSPESVRIR